MKQSHTQRPAVLSLFILLAACAPTQVLPTQTKIVSVEATNTLESNIVPTPISKSIPTATPESSCPRINSDIQFNSPKDASKFETSILDYLNEGGDPAKIEATTSKLEPQSLFTLSADIDDDSVSEVVISIGDFRGNPTIIHLLHCEQNNYQLVKSFTLNGISFGKPEFTTKIFDAEPFFIIVRAAHTLGWGQDFLGIGQHNSEWQIIKLATGTTPSEIALFDQNADGTKEVFIKTQTSATPGSGIGRVVVDSYSWDGKEFVPTSSLMPPGSDRVHYLDDAETAWQNGDPLLAISYYEIAARNPTLSSYWTSYELEHEQPELAKPYQQAFAFFRIVAIWFYLDRPDVAYEYIQEMSERFPKGNPGNELVQAVQAFSDWYKKDPDFSKSCSQAVNLLDTQYPNIVPNHLGDWGVANPIYFATSDICKLQ